MSGASRPSRDTPDTQRRRLRDALRRARLDSGLTQGSVAQQLYWSLSKVIRIETGAVPVVPVDVQAMARLYGLDDEQIEQLIEFSRAARKQSWSHYKDIYAPGVLAYFGNESAATTIYGYEPVFVDGLLQTPDYARALFKVLSYSDIDVDRRLEFRLQRQQLLDSEQPPQVILVLDEAAISRNVGGHETMLGQLEQIKRLAAMPNISIQLLPFESGGHRNMSTSIRILLFDDPGLPDLLYLEDPAMAVGTEDDPMLVNRYLSDLADLQSLADPPERLNAEIDRIARERFGKAE